MDDDDDDDDNNNNNNNINIIINRVRNTEELSAAVSAH